MAKTHPIRVDGVTYELVKAYAEDQDITVACAIKEILSSPCPVKSIKKLEDED